MLWSTKDEKKYSIIKIHNSDGSENIANGTASLESPGKLIVNFAPVPIPGKLKSEFHSNEKKTISISITSLKVNHLTIGYWIRTTIHLLLYFHVFKLFLGLFTQVSERIIFPKNPLI